ASTADVVIIDLEDAVAAGEKDAARENVLALGLGGDGALRAPELVQVRINAAGTPWYEADLGLMTQLAEVPVDIGVRVPKVRSGDEVSALLAALPGRAVHALIEDALGVERAFEIASAGVASIG